MTRRPDKLYVFGEDPCCYPRCGEAGVEFCDSCNGWYCLDHLKLKVGTANTASRYLCTACLSDPEQTHQAALQG
jgi:hypothetical protein